jgi:hypothetical protein
MDLCLSVYPTTQDFPNISLPSLSRVTRGGLEWPNISKSWDEISGMIRTGMIIGRNTALCSGKRKLCHVSEGITKVDPHDVREIESE